MLKAMRDYFDKITKKKIEDAVWRYNWNTTNFFPKGNTIMANTITADKIAGRSITADKYTKT